ncbi:nuclear transport factor 2 family protein [Streptomyces sp. S063]|uniref:nuclear transport factor 2 family protein n=1 Tax=Streptomyces sp. S063 TaxID=2005885 RepID=UPI00100848E0|nr:nuclear transport factor 2 family protein [Streptomyces sp. S063]
MTSSAAALPGGSAREPGATGVGCAGARAGIERLEGRITPNVCAFLERQLAFGRMATGTPPSAEQIPEEAVGHPRVAAYLDIFDPEATLWEAGSTPKTGRLVIGAAIAGSLRMVPDLHYTGTDVVADGGTVMFGQWNTATVRGHKVAYPQIARNVLGDEGRTIQARRYYDRHVLVRDTLPNAPKGLFDGIADRGTPPAGRPPHASPQTASPPVWPRGTQGTPMRCCAGWPGPGLLGPDWPSPW